MCFCEEGDGGTWLLGLAVAGTATFAAFYLFDGTLAENIRGFLKGLSSLESSYGVSLNSTYYNASAEGWVQGLAYVVNGAAGLHAARQALAHVTIWTEVLTFALLAWYLRYREQSLWRGTTLITLWILLVPDVVVLLRVALSFVPLALFVKYAPPTTRSIRIACLFGLAIAPKSYFYFGTGAIDVSVLLVAPTLIALTCAVVHDGIMQRRDDRTAGSPVESLDFGCPPCLVTDAPIATGTSWRRSRTHLATRPSVRQVFIGLVIAAALLAPGIAWSVQYHAHWI